MSGSNQNIETPWAFFNAVQEYFGISFTWDLAASAENTKCKNYYSESVNSLTADWPLACWCWLNPPFRHLSLWVKKCKEQKDRGVKIISIWPLSGDLNQIPAWSESRVFVIHGRIWPECRGIMLCDWSYYPVALKNVSGLRWDGKELKKVW